MDPIGVVDEFLHSYWHQQHERTLALAAEDFLWLNVPYPKLCVQGREALRQLLYSANMGFPVPVEEGHHVVGLVMARGEEVMQERVDRFRIRGTWMEIPCNGVWRVRDGQVALWKDYFDGETYCRQMAAVGLPIDVSPWL
ncbi:MAG: limonene-1,2-epoxide hydrolase family protein [Gammaproteobacteria bacterium]